MDPWTPVIMWIRISGSHLAVIDGNSSDTGELPDNNEAVGVTLLDEGTIKAGL
jgi:hypothetical protein